MRALAPADASWAVSLVAAHFGTARVVSRGKVHDRTRLPGMVAERGAYGLLQYALDGDACEVVTLIADPPRAGTGRALLDCATALARDRGCARIWLVTTNDHAGAIAFYRVLGWERVAVHRGALERARELKPEIPLRATDGTPIEDELEFELRIGAC